MTPTEKAELPQVFNSLVVELGYNPSSFIAEIVPAEKGGFYYHVADATERIWTSNYLPLQGSVTSPENILELVELIRTAAN